jgi:hypothetical protein
MAPVFARVAAYAQFVGHNYEEAIWLARESIRRRCDFPAAHRVLAAAAAMAGETDLAKAALGGLRHVQPNISLAWIAAKLPIKHAAQRERYLDGLRCVGLE